jgi:hypothetical protein
MYVQQKATNTGNTYWLLTLHAIEENSYKHSKELKFCLKRNCRNYFRQKTNLNWIASPLHTAKTLANTTVGMKLYLKQSIP